MFTVNGALLDMGSYANYKDTAHKGCHFVWAILALLLHLEHDTPCVVDPCRLTVFPQLTSLPGSVKNLLQLSKASR